jgi:hypothetical protein
MGSVSPSLFVGIGEETASVNAYVQSPPLSALRHRMVNNLQINRRGLTI